jgi:hypothetical protein
MGVVIVGPGLERVQQTRVFILLNDCRKRYRDYFDHVFCDNDARHALSRAGARRRCTLLDGAGTALL